MNIAICTIRSWNTENARNFANDYPEHSIRIFTPIDDINKEILKRFNPHFIFFPHWSDWIPMWMCETYKCIVFHMTDLPFGRGGSPLQNLISRKIFRTRVSAIRVNGEIDAGDIYWKSEEIDIQYGSAEDILKRVSRIVFDEGIPAVMRAIVSYKQEGRVVKFNRLQEQELPRMPDLEDYYDFIRMLDGEGYPRARITHKHLTGDISIQLFDAELSDGKVTGRFEITKSANCCISS